MAERTETFDTFLLCMVDATTQQFFALGFWILKIIKIMVLGEYSKIMDSLNTMEECMNTHILKIT